MNSVVRCPTCERSVEWNESAPWRPFCSERCKLIDLGAWASERHSIPGDTQDAEAAEKKLNEGDEGNE